MQPQAQTMPTTSAVMAIVECRNPPKATIITASTPRKERIVAADIDFSLERISSNSMIGRPVSPIFVPGISRLHFGGQLPQHVDRFGVLGEALLVFLQQPQEDEAHPAVVRHQPVGGRLGRQRTGERHFGPRRFVLAVLAQRRRQSAGDPRQLGLHGGQDLLALSGVGTAGHGRAHPAGHAAQVQLRPVALQHRARLVQEPVDLPQALPA